MEIDSADLRRLVDGLSDEGLEELMGALGARLCRDKYGADTIEGLMEKWGRRPPVPAAGSSRILCRCSLRSGPRGHVLLSTVSTKN